MKGQGPVVAVVLVVLGDQGPQVELQVVLHCVFVQVSVKPVTLLHPQVVTMFCEGAVSSSVECIQGAMILNGNSSY